MTKVFVPMMALEDAARLLRMLGNAARLSIILRLAQGGCSVADLEAELKIRQPNLSQHLAELREAGLLLSRKVGRAVHYSLAEGRAQDVVECVAKAIGTSIRPVPRANKASAGTSSDPQAGSAVFARVGPGPAAG